MTQHQRIKQYIDDFGSITPFQAFADLGITKLSTRIGEMIAAGEPIRKEFVQSTNRYGEAVRFMKYSANSS